MGVMIILFILLLKTMYHVLYVWYLQESMPLNKALLYQMW